MVHIRMVVEYLQEPTEEQMAYSFAVAAGQ